MGGGSGETVRKPQRPTCLSASNLNLSWLSSLGESVRAEKNNWSTCIFNHITEAIRGQGEAFELPVPPLIDQATKEYWADLRAGLDSLNTPPQNSEEAHEQFKDKRVIVQTLVEKVNIGKDRKLETTFKLDVLAVLKQLEHSNFGQRKEVEICSRRPTSHDFRLRAVCA